MYWNAAASSAGATTITVCSSAPWRSSVLAIRTTPDIF
jgi:hypothetical protein